MLKRILVGLAGTDYTPVAIRRGVELATLHDAAITGVTIVDPSRLSGGEAVPAGGGGLAKKLRERKAQVTEQRVAKATAQFVEQCESAGVKFRLEHEQGDAFLHMLTHSRYYDITVFGLRSVFEYYFEDDSSTELLERMIHSGARPIVAVSQVYRPIRRVLIGYSGSVESVSRAVTDRCYRSTSEIWNY